MMRRRAVSSQPVPNQPKEAGHDHGYCPPFYANHPIARALEADDRNRIGGSSRHHRTARDERSHASRPRHHPRRYRERGASAGCPHRNGRARPALRRPNRDHRAAHCRKHPPFGRFCSIAAASYSGLSGQDKRGMMNVIGPQIAFLPQDPAALPKASSSLVRGLVGARNDPAKQRIRAWLANLEDERLLSLGLTSQDIVVLRGSTQRLPEISQADIRTNGGSVTRLGPTLQREAAGQTAAAEEIGR